MKNLLLVLMVLLTTNAFAQTTITTSQFFKPDNSTEIIDLKDVPARVQIHAETIPGSRLVVEVKIEGDIPSHILDALRKGGKFRVVATQEDGYLSITMPNIDKVVVYKGKTLDLKIKTNFFIPDGLVTR